MYMYDYICIYIYIRKAFCKGFKGIFQNNSGFVEWNNFWNQKIPWGFHKADTTFDLQINIQLSQLR